LPRCEDCGKEFSTETALAQHLKDKHGKDVSTPAFRSSETKQARAPKSKGKSLRRRNRHPVAVGLAAVAIVVGLGLYIVVSPFFAGSPFPCIAEQSYYIHIHPYLRISVNGNNLTIPDNIGITQGGQCLEPIHTHDQSGILHIELAQAQANHNWTLADFFTIWHYTCVLQPAQCPTLNGRTLPVIFNQTDILGFRSDSTHKLLLLVNGTSSGDWGNLNLEKYDYCNATNSNGPPCSPTAKGAPGWNCVVVAGAFKCGTYPYSTGNRIIIEYTSR
jgi:hypothetical protein